MRLPHNYLFVIGLFLLVSSSQAEEEQSLEQINAAAATQSKYLSTITVPSSVEGPMANLEGFRAEIEHSLKKAYYERHGSENSETKFRVDTMDAALRHDVESNDEMPPEDGPKLADDDRSGILPFVALATGRVC